jgi:hypothetical protein
VKRALQRFVPGIAAAVLALAPAPAMAADAIVTRAADLRAERYVDAPAIRRVDEGARVDILNIEAGWVQIRVDGATGWVRATSLSGEGAAAAPLARLDTGRAAPNNIVVAAGIRGIPKASRLALIVGVEGAGSQGAVSAHWAGVADDVESARLVAQALGFPADNVEIVQGKDATLRGVEDAFDRLVQRTQAGDQVFIYFSGPGALVRSEPPSDSCSGAWVTADAKSLSARQLTARLRPLFNKAGKILVLSDAAYAASGAEAQAAPDLTRKFLPSVDSPGCAAPPGNPVMPLVDVANRAGAPEANLVLVQSAAGPLQGLDQAHAGGLFTQLWVDCLLGDATDTDGSGAVSIVETAACVNRQRIALRSVAVAGGQGALATVSGNAGFSPVSTAPGVHAAAAGASAAAASAATPSRVNPVAGADGANPIDSSPRAALDDVLAQRDGRVRVELAATPATLQVGKDFLDLRLTSSSDGYVYLILLGSDERSFYLLFPNALDRDNHVAAGETLRLPRARWQVQAQGPPGRDVVVAVVAESERDLTTLDGKAGPFSTALTDLEGRARLQWLLGRSSAADAERCRLAGKKRNLAAVKSCSDAFGAARVEVVEQ